MTESEWLSSTEPGAMLAWLCGDVAPAMQPLDARRKISECKLRLIDAALLTTMGCNIPAIAFMVAHSQRSAASGILRDIVGNPFRPVTLPPAECLWHDGVKIRSTPILSRHAYATPAILSLAQAAYEQGHKCGRCVLDPDRLAVIADALEEAGCECEDLLWHLRGQERCVDCLRLGLLPVPEPTAHVPCPRCRRTGWVPLRNPHYRGCWVLDLILGRE